MNKILFMIAALVILLTGGTKESATMAITANAFGSGSGQRPRSAPTSAGSQSWTNQVGPGGPGYTGDPGGFWKYAFGDKNRAVAKKIAMGWLGNPKPPDPLGWLGGVPQSAYDFWFPRSNTPTILPGLSQSPTGPVLSAQDYTYGQANSTQMPAVTNLPGTSLPTGPSDTSYFWTEEGTAQNALNNQVSQDVFGTPVGGGGNTLMNNPAWIYQHQRPPALLKQQGNVISGWNNPLEGYNPGFDGLNSAYRGPLDKRKEQFGGYYSPFSSYYGGGGYSYPSSNDYQYWLNNLTNWNIS
jgi:hypothetical protein